MRGCAPVAEDLSPEIVEYAVLLMGGPRLLLVERKEKLTSQLVRQLGGCGSAATLYGVRAAVSKVAVKLRLQLQLDRVIGTKSSYENESQ